MLLNCPATTPQLAVPQEIMRHVVRVESAGNPYAIGVVRGRLARQPRRLDEAVATARMLEERGFNFSLGLAQVNRYNLRKYDLATYEKAFDPCANLVAGSRILKECFDRSQDWGKAFSCYYSGNFITGFRHGYVQKVVASMRAGSAASTPVNGGAGLAIPVIPQVSAAKKQRSSEAAGQRRPVDARLMPVNVSRSGATVPPQSASAAVAQPANAGLAPFVATPVPQAVPIVPQPKASAESADVSVPQPVTSPARDSSFVF